MRDKVALGRGRRVSMAISEMVDTSTHPSGMREAVFEQPAPCERLDSCVVLYSGEMVVHEASSECLITAAKLVALSSQLPEHEGLTLVTSTCVERPRISICSEESAGAKLFDEAVGDRSVRWATRWPVISM